MAALVIPNNRNLLDGAREAIEDEAVLAVRRKDAVLGQSRDGRCGILEHESDTSGSTHFGPLP